MYKHVEIWAKETDIESEAESLAKQGILWKLLFSVKSKAKDYMYKSIELINTF